MIALKKPQTRRERLESLIKQACHYAEWNLREYGQVPPSAMALTKKGIFLMTPPKLGSESEKDKFADDRNNVEELRDDPETLGQRAVE
jgi:hypothetical protein